jgi:hypothetical protein
VWKYISIWIVNLGLAIAPTPGETAADPANPIQAAYSWATLVSTLTDRALWLFFLFVILGIAWWIDRRKERELDRYRKQQDTIIATLSSVDRLLERIERKLDD